MNTLDYCFCFSVENWVDVDSREFASKYARKIPSIGLILINLRTVVVTDSRVCE